MATKNGKEFLQNSFRSRAIQTDNTTEYVGSVGADGTHGQILATKLPVTEATTTALALKANLLNPVFEGVVSVPTPTTDEAAANKGYVDSVIVGLLNDRGQWDASGNSFPTTGGSGTGGLIRKGDLWYVSVAGKLGGVDVNVGDSFRALTNNPAQVASNWGIFESNIGYVPENVANKQNNLNSDSTNAKYPTVTAVNSGLALKANLESPTFTGAPLTTTPAAGDNSTKIASTAFVAGAITAAGTNKEDKSNKQNSLVADATNTKYPTVTAVNSGLDLKAGVNNALTFWGARIQGSTWSRIASFYSESVAAYGNYIQLNIAGSRSNYVFNVSLYISSAVGTSMGEQYIFYRLHAAQSLGNNNLSFRLITNTTTKESHVEVFDKGLNFLPTSMMNVFCSALSITNDRVINKITSFTDGTQIPDGFVIREEKFIDQNIAISGNVESAAKLTTARNINGVAFDGTANITVLDSTKVSKTGDTMTGELVLPSATISTAPTTSAATYDILTRNSTSGKVEKIPSSSIPVNNTLIHTTGDESKDGILTLLKTPVFSEVPETSTAGYDVLTRNSTTGEVEKVSGSSIAPQLIMIDYPLLTADNSTFAIPAGKTAKIVSVNGATYYQLTENNTTLWNTFNQLGANVILKTSAEVGNYVSIFYQ